MDIRHYPEDDAVLILVRDVDFSYGEILDDSRHLYFDENGALAGVGLLNVSGGVALDRIPGSDMDMGEMSDLLQKNNVKVHSTI